ncbi:MAG: succinate dehydrogenase, partial [Bacteroidota bacterium]|nr:succinate dehydrogenase [Bacteroidota bacterium]
MAEINVATTHRGFGYTNRKDAWWARPLIIFIGLSAFVVYVTWAALQGKHYTYGPYLSPLYSPELFGDSPHSWFGAKPGWWPGAIPWSPALLVLWAPGLFRLTCYYYRGAYYKSFWADPPSCAVSEPRKKYRGENSFPLIIQNIHRYFLYIALAFIIFLSIDVLKALWFTNASTGEKSFGMGVGTLVLAVNVVLLGGYTFGCHSLRHMVGGFMDRLSGAPVRRKMYMCVSCLNSRH